MKYYIKKLIPYALIYFLAFDIFPIAYYFGNPASVAKILLLIVNPAVSIILGFVFGIKNGFKWYFILASAITFTVSVFIYYDISVILHGLFYCGFSMLGLALGWLFSHISQ